MSERPEVLTSSALIGALDSSLAPFFCCALEGETYFALYSVSDELKMNET